MLNNQTQLIRVPRQVAEIFEDQGVLKDFKSILYGGAESFIKSAMICIASSNDLMKCTPQSLASGALRSATLGLSLDPALRQAWLVPRPLNGVPTACFQPHYNGLYNLAVRTGLYRTINVTPIHDDEQVVQDPRTGLHYITSSGDNWVYKPHRDVQGLDNGFRDVTKGQSKNPIIGYFGYYLTRDGSEKTVWMTLPEIQAHAIKWSPASYNSSKGAWQDNRKRPTMEMKTVFIALSKFMDLTGPNNEKLKAALEDDRLEDDENTITTIAEDVPEEAPLETLSPTSEIPYESAVPAGIPSKAKPNQVITDSEWETFGKLVQRATNANVTLLPEYVREKMTPDLLNGATHYLKGKLSK
jgi:recombination protein RecT